MTTGVRRPAETIGLDPDTVVGEALRLIDRDGLDAFSVRGLARSLGVNPTAVVWHVGSRDQLLSAVVGRVLADLTPGRRGPWDASIRGTARRFRAAVFRHPNVAPLIGTRLTANTSSQVAVLEILLEALHDAGLRGRRQRDALNAVIGSLIGFVTLELATAPDHDVEAFIAEVQARANEADPASTPHFVVHRAALANRSFVYRWTGGADAPLNSAFEALLDLLLAGIRAESGRRQR